MCVKADLWDYKPQRYNKAYSSCVRRSKGRCYGKWKRSFLFYCVIQHLASEKFCCCRFALCKGWTSGTGMKQIPREMHNPAVIGLTVARMCVCCSNLEAVLVHPHSWGLEWALALHKQGHLHCSIFKDSEQRRVDREMWSAHSASDY